MRACQRLSWRRFNVLLIGLPADSLFVRALASDRAQRKPHLLSDPLAVAQQIKHQFGQR